MAMRVQQNSGSSTSVMELELDSVYMSTALPKQDTTNEFSVHGPSRQASMKNDSGYVPEQDRSPLPPPSIASEVLQRWNYPRKNIPRLAACFWSFVVMGSTDAAYGVSVSVQECKLNTNECADNSYV